MDPQPKSKVLILIIGILLIANIATISFLLMNKDGGRPLTARQVRQAMIRTYLEKEVGFTKQQLTRYDTMSKMHHDETVPVLEAISAKREDIFKKLALQEFNDSALNVAAVAIADNQRPFQVMMLRHVEDIRNICTPAQKAAFDSGIYKIISKRGEIKKGK